MIDDEAAGFERRPRLPVYPEFITDKWIDSELMPKVQDSIDSDGYAAIADKVGAQ